MYITSFFTKDGIPTVGLTPTLRIRQVSDNSLIVSDSTMDEIGDGWYKYYFSGYNKNIEYVIRSDGGSFLSDSERYAYAGNENYIDDLALNFDSTSIDFSQIYSSLDTILALILGLY